MINQGSMCCEKKLLGCRSPHALWGSRYQARGTHQSLLLAAFASLVAGLNRGDRGQSQMRPGSDKGWELGCGKPVRSTPQAAEDACLCKFTMTLCTEYSVRTYKVPEGDY